MKLIKSLDKDQGSIAIIVALGLTMLMGLGALVTDIGMLYAEKAKLQNAVDAAALAGAQELPHNPTRAQEVAQEYATLNKASEISINFGARNSKIMVSAQKIVPTLFAKIWGIDELKLTARAHAMMVPPSSLVGAVPLSIEKQDFVYGVTYTLKFGSGASTETLGSSYQGWFGPLRLSGSGAKDYTTDLANGYNGNFQIGQIVDIETGNMSGPTKQGIEERLARDTRVPRNTFDNFDRDAPEIVYVPIVEVVNRTSSTVNQVKIVGFAGFFLEGVSGNGTESIINGRFIKTLVPNKQGNNSLSDLLKQEEQMEDGSTVIDYGLYTPKLVDR
jgi:hypothetical protein